MLEEISYFLILEIPFIIWIGIITLFSFLFTASISILNKKGINKIPFKWHSRMAIVSIILAIIHGMLAVLAYF